MELSGFVPVLRRWWLVIMLATLVAGIVGSAVISQLKPTYETTTRLLVGPISTDDSGDLRISEQLTQTYAELITGEILLEETIRDVPLSISVPELRLAVSARGDRITRLLTITVQLPNAAQAAATADQLAAALSRATTAEPNTPGSVQVIEPAVIPLQPAAPLPLAFALSAIAGFTGALLLVLFADYFVDRVRGRAELQDLGGVSLLGSVPIGPKPARSIDELMREAQAGPDAATYRRLAALMLRPEDGSPHSLMVAGTGGHDRSAEVAVNIAIGATLGGQPAAVVDADDAERAVTRLLGAAATQETLHGGQAIVRGALELHPYPGLPFSSRPEAHVQAALESFAQDGRVVVVSSGALANSPTAVIWAGECDSIVLVVVRDATRRRAVADAVSHIRLLGPRHAGILLAEPIRSGRSFPWRRARAPAQPSAATEAGTNPNHG